MNIGSRIASLLALSTLLTVSAELSHAQSVDPPFNRMISDFGPRNVTSGSFFHRGIDYNPQAGNTRGTPIPSVEAGVVAGAGLHGRTGIRFSQDIWLIDVVGPLGSFQYMHIFETDPVPTPEAWQISGAFALGAIVDGVGRTVYFIVRYTDETRTTVADAFIDDDHSGTEVLPGIYAASPVEARRLIAPIGASGVGDPHLHLGLNLTQDNPLYHVRHTPDGLPTAVVEAPTPNMVFTQEQLASPYALKVRINSLGSASIEDRTFGLDLDKVSLYILRNGDPLQPIHLGAVGQPTYGYGGRPEENATDTATRRPTTSLSGVDPQGNVAGDDRMVFLVDLQTVDNGNPLPDGNHILEVRCRDVNDHPACLEADGSYTQVSFTIGSPLYVAVVSSQSTSEYDSTLQEFHAKVMLETRVADAGGADLYFYPCPVKGGDSALCWGGPGDPIVISSWMVAGSTYQYRQLDVPLEDGYYRLQLVGRNGYIAASQFWLQTVTNGRWDTLAELTDVGATQNVHIGNDSKLKLNSHPVTLMSGDFEEEYVSSLGKYFYVWHSTRQESALFDSNGSALGRPLQVTEWIAKESPRYFQGLSFGNRLGTIFKGTFVGGTDVAQNSHVRQLISLGPSQTFGSYRVLVRTGETLDELLVAGFQPFVDSTYDVAANDCATASYADSPQIKIAKFVQFKFELTRGSTGIERGKGSHYDASHDSGYTVYFGNPLGTLSANLEGGSFYFLSQQIFSEGSQLLQQGGWVQPGVNVAVNIAPGVSIEFPEVTTGGQITVGPATACPAVEGMGCLLAMNIDQGQVRFNGQAKVSFSFNPTNLTAAQINAMQAVHDNTNCTTSIDGPNGIVTCEVMSFSPFYVLYPLAPTEVHAGDVGGSGTPEISASELQTVTLTLTALDVSSPSLAAFLSSQSAAGLGLVSSPYWAHFEPFAPSSPALVQITYLPETLTGLQIDENTLVLYGFDPETNYMVPLEDQHIDLTAHVVSARLPHDWPGLAVFGSLPLPPDVTPPMTSFNYEGESDARQTKVFVSTSTRIALLAQDHSTFGSRDLVSGVATTYLLINLHPADGCGFSNMADVVIISSMPVGSCQNPIYAGSFLLNAGVHELWYMSADKSGNVEDLRYFRVRVDSMPPVVAWDIPEGSALGLGRLVNVALSEQEIIPGKSGSGVDTTTLHVLLDEREITDIVQSDTVSIRWNLTEMSQGTHTFTVNLMDGVGNLAVSSLNFIYDATPPQSSLSASEGRFAGGILYMPVSAGLAVSATDYPQENPAGVAAAYIGIDGAQPEALAGPIYLSTGMHTAAWYAVDAAGNVESSHTASVRVDGMAPAAVTDFSMSALSTSSLRVSWTAPGDDGVEGAIAKAKIRILYNQTGVNFSTADAQVVLDRTNLAPGSVMESTLDGLTAGITYYGVVLTRDTAGNWSAISNITSAIPQEPQASFEPDILVPRTSLVASSSSTIGGQLFIGTGTLLGFEVVDDSRTVGDLAGVGVAYSSYSVDDAAFAAYASSFTLEVGTHTLRYFSADLAGNVEAVHVASMTVVPATSISPSSGPIGIPFVITGFGFGEKRLTSGKVRFGPYNAVVSSWTDGRIAGTVPGVSSGTWSVEVLRQWPSSSTVLARTSFEAALPQLWDVIPDSGPIGVRFTLLGDGFGAWAGSLRNQVFFEGSTVPVSSWKDDAIQGTVPGFLSLGVHSIWVRRTTTDGGLMESSTAQFELIVMSPQSLNPSTGPIGVPITITGSGFGARSGASTLVWVGASTAAVYSWTDTKIIAKVPGMVKEPYCGPGETICAPVAGNAYPVEIERIQGEYADRVAVGSFTVTPLAVSSFAPSSGPIGTPITLLGPGFGPRDGNWTQVLFAGATVPITSWADAKVTFDAPGGFGNGAQSIVLRRTTTDGGLMESTPVSFEIINMSPASMNPSTGPIGIPITITGAGFGAWDGVNTRVLINGATVHVNSWVDTKISADIPGLPAGEYPVAVERAQGGYTDTVAVGSFTVTPLAVSSFAPSSGPIGTPITLLGPGFGPYDGTWTQVLFAGTTVPVTSWSDAKVTFDAPGGFGNGPQSIVLRRTTTDGGLMGSAPVVFEIINMSPAGMNPSTGPIGIPITITGAGFGVWSGQETRLRIGASTVPVTSWTNTKITAKIPGMGHESYCEGAEACAMQPGIYPVSIQRVQGAADESVFVASFTLTPLIVSSLAPVQAPIGSSFTLTGTGFGPANGAYTQVLINGTSAPLVTWTDTKIGAKVPGSLAPGSYPLWIERRTTDGAVQASASMDFTVVVPQISSMTPTAGKAGTAVTLYGGGFGYNAGASYNRVLINGIAAALSSWTDVKIKCIVPDSLAIGTYPVVVERTPAGGAVQSNALEYSVTAVKSVSMLGVLAGPGRVEEESASAQAGAWNLPDWDYEAELSIPAQEGGRVESAIRASVDLPAAAVAEDIFVSMRKGRQAGEQAESKRAAAQMQAGLSAAGPGVEFGPDGTQFDIPATIELPYSLASDQQAGTLALYWWDPEAGKWTQVPTEMDASKAKLRARVSHFSLYQPMAQSARPSAASEAFALHEIYVFPNPARGEAKPTFHVEVGLADGLSIRIYDVSGRLVHSGGIEGSPGTVDDGQGLEYAYEYVWEGRIASGVYFYAIEAKKAGQGSLRKTGKLAVVR